jgi:plastocyanin
MRLLGRRSALIVMGQLGLGLTAAACAPNVNRPAATPSAASGASGAAATLTSAQSAASPAAQPATSPVAGGAPAASPAAVANPQASPVVGAAPLPQPAPTPGGPPPTVVGSVSTPAPQPNAVGSFPNEGPPASPVAVSASPAASPAVAVASPSAQPAAATVMLTPDHRFDPPQVTISRGQTVLWRNTSRNPQTVTCNPALASDPSHVVLPPGAQAFDSGVININTTYSHTFDTPGDYQYLSLPFEAQNMFGRITVE